MELAATQDATAQSSSVPSSEIGSIGQDVGSVIGKWQGKLNQALNQWLDDAKAISDLLNTAHSVTGELQGMIHAYQNYPAELVFTASQYNRMIDMMNDLGVPLSMVEGGDYDSNGHYDFTGSQYHYDIQLAIQYLVADLPNFQAQISNYKQDETQDMFKVMACLNGVKMNEETLSGTLNTLASLSQSLMQDIQ